jgi:hypothetical protein
MVVEEGEVNWDNVWWGKTSEASLYDAQKALKELDRRTKMMPPQGVLAELRERMGENHD